MTLTEVELFKCSQLGPLYLEAVGMDNLVADRALHKHEVELVLLFLQCVLLPCLFTHHTHRCVGQDRLHGSKTNKKLGINKFNINEPYYNEFCFIVTVSANTSLQLLKLSSDLYTDKSKKYLLSYINIYYQNILISYLIISLTL